MKPIKPRHRKYAAEVRAKRRMEMESQLASGELKVHRVGELTPSDRDALEKRLRLR